MEATREVSLYPAQLRRRQRLGRGLFECGEIIVTGEPDFGKTYSAQRDRGRSCPYFASNIRQVTVPSLFTSRRTSNFAKIVFSAANRARTHWKSQQQLRLPSYRTHARMRARARGLLFVRKTAKETRRRPFRPRARNISHCLLPS